MRNAFMENRPSPAFRARRRRRAVLAGALAACSTLGCSTVGSIIPDHGPGPHDTTESFHDDVGMTIEYPDAKECYSEPSAQAMATAPPLTFEDPANLPTRDMELADAIRIAVGQSPVLRSLGGSVVQVPQGTPTIYDPALSYANPLGGVEAALSAFDAQVNGVLNWNKVEVPNNIQQAGLGAVFNPPALLATQSNFNWEIAKQTAQGGRFALRHNVIYDRNNRPFRQFQSDFVGWFEAEWRQPLMQGSGTLFNRIAGPSGAVGQYNGVLIARINNDVSLADFEAAVIQLIADVEQAYWELYGAYRNLETQLRGREAALKTYQNQRSRTRFGLDDEGPLAQATSQYHLFDSQVQNALAGPGGIYVLEQRLRYLLGLPASDGELIKPATDPQTARVVFDWRSALDQALERRVEIRRQKWNVKRRELELIASRLNRRPRLDFLGQYRWRGLGDHLIGDGNNGAFDNLYDNIFGGDYQEWVAGMELSFPVGLRQASVAVSHAQLNLARDRAVLGETELRVSHDLANAVREVERAHRLLQTNLNRWLADQKQVEVLTKRVDIGGLSEIFVLLQAQRQVVVSENAFYQSLVDYNLAIRDLHRQKGSLLAYNQVQLAEGPWAPEAYGDAYKLGRFFTPRVQPEKVYQPRPVSQGPFEPSAPVDTGGALFEPSLIESAPPVTLPEPSPEPPAEAPAPPPQPADDPS
jgi:outer membrane protein TolC